MAVIGFYICLVWFYRSCSSFESVYKVLISADYMLQNRLFGFRGYQCNRCKFFMESQCRPFFRLSGSVYTTHVAYPAQRLIHTPIS